MEFIKDYEFRKLVAEYLHWMFTTGIDRVIAHQAVCNYLIDHWNIYKDVKDNPEKRETIETDLHLRTKEYITDDVVTNLGYPVTADGFYDHNPKHRKKLIDNFCKALDKIKPILEEDMEFWFGDGKRHRTKNN